MRFEVLTVAATLAGLSAAAPGNGWSNMPSFPGKSGFPGYPYHTTSSTATSVKATSAPHSGPTGGYPSGGPSGPPSGSTVTTTVTVTATSACASGPGGPGGPPSGPPSGTPSGPPTACYLSPAQATSIITTYDSLTNRNIHGAEFNATADALLDETYSLTSNSVNADEGLPLNQITIPSKEVFISLFWNVPQGNGETFLDIFNSCDQIAWRWLGTNPSNETVRGITTMTITEAGKVGPVFTEYFNPTLDRCA